MKFHFLNSNITSTFGFPLSTWSIGNTESPNAVILLPGFLDSKDYFHLKKLGEVLADQGLLVLAIDGPGIWESEGHKDNYSMTNIIKSIDSVRSDTQMKYGPKQWIVMGHSLGGLISLQYDLSTVAQTITCPKLFIAGESDELIVPALVESIFQYMSEPKYLSVLKGVEHNYRNSVDQTNMVNQAVIDFLQKYDVI